MQTEYLLALVMIPLLRFRSAAGWRTAGFASPSRSYVTWKGPFAVILSPPSDAVWYREILRGGRRFLAWISAFGLAVVATNSASTAFGCAFFSYAVNILLLLPLLVAAYGIATRWKWLPLHWAPLASVAVVAGMGFVAFWCYFLAPNLGRIFGCGVMLVALGWCCWFCGPVWLRGIGAASDAVYVLGIGIAAGAFYIAAFELPFGGNVPVSFYREATQRFLPLPDDNVLPELLADGTDRGACPKNFGDWKSSDRPPLQAGWLLLNRVVVDRLGRKVDYASATAAVILQLSWIAGAYGLICAFGMATSTAFGIVAAIAFTGFFFIHTVYTWPKEIAASLICGAWALLVIEPAPDRETLRYRGIWAGFMIGLGLLAHPGVGFSLIAMAPWIFVALRRGRAVPWIYAATMVLLLHIPWLAFKHFYAPPGDRLLKMHLAGENAVDARGLWQTLVENYRALGWKGALKNRLDSAGWLIDGPAVNWRQHEFYFTVRALNFWSIGFIPLILMFARRSVSAVRLGFISVTIWSALTVGGWVALMFVSHSTIVHQGSLAVPLCLLCILAGALRLTTKIGFAVTVVAQLISFWAVWVLPDQLPLRQLFAPALLCAIVAGACLLLPVVLDLARPSERR